MVIESFGLAFGEPPAVQAAANGRVNLIGEHTDYNDGFVLPMAVPLRTRVALRPRDDRIARVASRELDAGVIREYEVGTEQAERDWLDYVRGVTWALAAAGFEIGGFEA